LLDLERELQAIDPSVSLPYWRFDEPAPNIFRSNFMGATTQTTREGSESLVAFDPGHPLAGWVTDGQPGILRSSVFDTQTSAAPGWPEVEFPRLSQAETLALGDRFEAFATMEGSPHGATHVSFLGAISSVNTAVKDPLFFLLHANVDRLWALWQWLNRRMAPTNIRVYAPENRDGRRLDDTLWPWNGVVALPRPNFAPGGPMPASPVTPMPGAAPTVRSVVDFEGHVSPPARIGYGYDDVPFEFT
jgi:tyrosinase